MRSLFIVLVSVIALVSCKGENKPLSEDFNAICFVSLGNEIELGNDLYMHSPKIHYILFTYHDTVFQAAIKDEKTTYSYLKFRNKGKDSLQSIFKEYNKTTLAEQLKSLKKNEILISCAPEGYFLSGNMDQTNFGIFYYNDYGNWLRRYSHKEIKLKSDQFPNIYNTIYHTMNSKQWDYVMSNDYYYKDVRAYGKIKFIIDSVKYTYK
ncbi:MAG: hypothetical protein ACO1N0_03910 [Fluviicola sp.]